MVLNSTEKPLYQSPGTNYSIMVHPMYHPLDYHNFPKRERAHFSMEEEKTVAIISS